MLLFLLSSSRHLRTPLIVASLLVGLAGPGVCADLPVPILISATPACTSATLTWSDSGNAMYMLMVFFNGSPVAFQSVMGTSFTFDGLSVGDYTVMIQAVALSPTDNSSPMSGPLPFKVSCGPVCTTPVISLAQPNPAVLCTGHDKLTPVLFAGMVTSLCPIASASYTLTDSLGSTTQRSLTVASDGSFGVTLSLAAKHPGRRYVFSASATNSVGSVTSSPVIVSVDKGCGELAEAYRHHHPHHDIDDD